MISNHSIIQGPDSRSSPKLIYIVSIGSEQWFIVKIAKRLLLRNEIMLRIRFTLGVLREFGPWRLRFTIRLTEHHCMNLINKWRKAVLHLAPLRLWLCGLTVISRKIGLPFGGFFVFFFFFCLFVLSVCFVLFCCCCCCCFVFVLVRFTIDLRNN